MAKKKDGPEEPAAEEPVFVAERRYYTDPDGNVCGYDNPHRIFMVADTGDTMPMSKAEELGLVAFEAAQKKADEDAAKQAETSGTEETPDPAGNSGETTSEEQ